ncbi:MULTISPECIES: phage holin family protein [unclassified Serinicoccus]|uniref:phage holin family protein n=1 Tax=unclassified Serinicoccus TaxID=2643101 RepID=UPI00385233EE
MRLIFDIVANGVALWVAAALISGIEFGGEGGQMVLTIALVAAIFGVLNALVRPVVQVLSIPLIVLTLGLFLFVINAFMLSLTSWVSGLLNLDFHVESFFWDAVLGSIIISIVSMVVGALLPSPRRVD